MSVNARWITVLLLFMLARPAAAQDGLQHPLSVREQSPQARSIQAGDRGGTHAGLLPSAADHRVGPSAGGTMGTPQRAESISARGDAPLALPPRSRRQTSERRRATGVPTSDRALASVVGSLAIVLGAFFLVAWVSRRSAPKGSAPLPTEVVELLGRAPLAGRTQMQLVRVGNKLILLSVTPQSVETLAEITDQVEVDRLAGICRQNQPGSITATFRQVLNQYNGESTAAVSSGELSRPGRLLHREESRHG